MMKRIALILLLFGVTLGLAAQAPARALAPASDAKVAAAMAAMPDCMEQMDKSGPHKPFNCSRADCIAAMLGGPTLLTVANPSAGLSSPASVSLDPMADRAAALVGRDLGPEPDPPNSLI